MKAWSYSSLTSFETCPHRYNLTKNLKVVVEPETEVQRWGNDVHKALEDRINGVPLTEKFVQYEPFVEAIERVGKPKAETKMALTKDFSATTFFAKNVWCRGIIDTHTVVGNKGMALDWKTGKPKPDSSQLKLFAAMMFHTYPELEEVQTGFVWLAHDKLTKDVFTRNQLGEIWGEFLPRVKRLEIAYDEDKWVPKPSGLCRAWCPVGKENCSHCGS
jgi:hypothetical protein